MNVAEQCRIEGNERFAQGDVVAAVQAYERGIHALQSSALAASHNGNDTPHIHTALSTIHNGNDNRDTEHMPDENSVSTNELNHLSLSPTHHLADNLAKQRHDLDRVGTLSSHSPLPTSCDPSLHATCVYTPPDCLPPPPFSSSASSTCSTCTSSCIASSSAATATASTTAAPSHTIPTKKAVLGEAHQRLAVLYANLSHALLILGHTARSAAAARTATLLDPHSIKAWLRYIEARRSDGYAFDAFVCYLQHVRPRMGGGDARLTRETESALAAALRLSRLHAGLALVDGGPDGGGLSLVCRRRLEVNEVLFCEEKYTARFTSADGQGSVELSIPTHTHNLYHSNSNDDNSDNNHSKNSTIHLAQHFAQHLRAPQQAQSDEWRQFRRDLVGAWPRALHEVTASVRQRTRDMLQQHWPTLTPEACEEMLMVCLMCRFNCFYTGFFRVCALANHSCCANVAMKYDAATQRVTMITVRAVEPGAKLYVKYLSDAHFLLGLAPRRAVLRSWEFCCDCVRCRRDAEPQAMQEALACPVCEAFVHFAVPYAVTDEEEVEDDIHGDAQDEGEHNSMQSSHVCLLPGSADMMSESANAEHGAVVCAGEPMNVSESTNITPAIDAHDHARSRSEVATRVSVLRCVSCQSALDWNTPTHRRRVKALLDGFRTHTSSGHDGAALFDWLRTQLTALKALRVHPVHWMYRELFYFVCVALIPMISQTMRLLAVDERLFGTAAATLLRPCGMREGYTARLYRCADAKGTDESVATAPPPPTTTTSRRGLLLCTGGEDLRVRWSTRWLDLPVLEECAAEVLHVFVVMWHLIVDFYPAYEMWAVHQAVCDLVLMHILVTDVIHLAPANTSSSSSSVSSLLSRGVALALLQRHGPYVGASSASSWIHTLQAHRKMLTTSAKYLPTMTQLKQAFKLR